MAEKFDQFSMARMAALAASPAGQQLLAMIRQAGGSELQQAADRAAAGDLTGARELLGPILDDPQIRAMLGRLGAQ